MPETPGSVGAVFVTTHWSVVLTAQNGSPASREAIEQLSHVYWRPVYSFIRRGGRSEEEAQNLTQGFFAQLMERGDPGAVRRAKGRLRVFLLESLKSFLANELRHAEAVQRGAGRTPRISAAELLIEAGLDQESPSASADRIYDQRWAVTVLDQTIARLTNEQRRLPHPALTARLTELLAEEPDRACLAGIAREFGLSDEAVKQESQRLRERYRHLLREEIAHTVGRADEIEGEARTLVLALAA